MAMSPETVEVHSREEWRAWLESNHQQKESILLVTWRKDASDYHVSWDAIVEEALCFGWIDGTRRSLGDGRMSLLLAPRRKGSGWSRVNKDRIVHLIASGRMTPAGMAAIDRGQRDGSWSRLDAADALVVPADLQRALESTPDAFANFTTFPASSRKVMLQWVYDAKRPETRAKRIDEIVTKAARNERAR